MPTIDIVPRADGEGNIGTKDKNWGGGSFNDLRVKNLTVTGWLNDPAHRKFSIGENYPAAQSNHFYKVMSVKPRGIWYSPDILLYISPKSQPSLDINCYARESEIGGLLLVQARYNDKLQLENHGLMQMRSNLTWISHTYKPGMLPDFFLRYTEDNTCELWFHQTTEYEDWVAYVICETGIGDSTECLWKIEAPTMPVEYVEGGGRHQVIGLHRI